MLLGVTSLALPTSEYQAVTEACGLVDRSQRGKLALTGSQVKSFLQGQVTNDVEALTPGEGCYAAFLTPKGKMLGDLRILDTGALQHVARPTSDPAGAESPGAVRPQVARPASDPAGPGDAGVVQLLLDTERVALQELFNMIRRFCIGYDVELHKRTLQSGLVSLIGPASEQVIGMKDLPRAEHSHVMGALYSVTARVIRTDVGIDLLCEADDTRRLLSELSARGVPTISESVAECVRIEHGRPRYGIDLDDGVIPQEAGLNERAVSFTKGCYVGQETVARLFYRGKPNRHLRGLRLSEPVPAGVEVSFGGRSVGRITSVADSPALGPIALAFIRREAPPGSAVDVGSGAIGAEVVELPLRR
jgi:folate-binding protein YgfZ